MIYSLYIPLALLFVPWLLVRFVFTTEKTRRLPYLKHAPYLWAAAALWWLALFVPNVPLSPETETFSMHFTGGGVAVILFLYVVKVYQLKFTYTWQAWMAMFMFVSTLGVLNELLEFFLDVTRIMPMPRGDTWWDLWANTLGALFVYFAVRLYPKK
jgi:hypothetical protein